MHKSRSLFYGSRVNKGSSGQPRNRLCRAAGAAPWKGGTGYTK